MRSMVVAAGAVLAVALGIGTAAAQDAPAGPPVDVVFTTNKLDRDIVVGAPIVDRIGPLQRLALPLENSSRKAKTLEYKVEWFDQAGAPAGVNLAWKTVFLDAREQKSIQEVAQRPSAVSARIFVRSVGAAE